ncbi:uncharacterized protein perm1 [Siniperca chuatsi]|uniref:uncharacterized protein perm1 n=1 Tax=Siniperca chuatsi TaxID=119488 RepID=UPI001CE122D0|nr:uncharacterized protein perm1 [Siniperca chuatsi]
MEGRTFALAATCDWTYYSINNSAECKAPVRHMQGQTDLRAETSLKGESTDTSKQDASSFCNRLKSMRGIKMDDLDHSMHIAEYDWTSFYEDSEECVLLQPSLACPDNSSLSDSEDSGNSSSVFSVGRQELQQTPAANSDEAESNAAGCCMEEVQVNRSGAGGERDDLTTTAGEESEIRVNSYICLDYPGGNVNTEETTDNITITLQPNVQSSDGESTELRKEDGKVQTESGTCKLKSMQQPDPLSCNQTEVNVNEPHATDRAVSSVALRAEKERWFVTVNNSPARQRVRGPSVKKKQRPKKTCKDTHMCRTPGQEKSLENGLEMEINKDNNKSEGRRDTVYVTQSHQNFQKLTKSGWHPSAEDNPESVQMGVTSDSSQVSLTSGEEDNLSEKLVTFHSPEENVTEPTTDRNKHDPSCSASTSHDTFTPKEPSRVDSVESVELEDSVEFFSTHSYESESYLSATESVEEPPHLLMENYRLQNSLSLTENSHLLSLTEDTDADDTQGREKHSCHISLSCNVTATNSEGYERAYVEPALIFPSAGQSANKMPDDNSTCVNNTQSTVPRMPSDTPGLQKHELNLSASGCSSGDQLSLPPVPDLTLTPGSVADSPETYAEATGHTRPVYAISAFWDEMEKLTINDILQLRVGRSTPPRETQGIATPNVDDFPTDHSSLADTVEYNLSDGGLMDTSDTADSDYFTQPDESKPDRSSCEFSTSDFEEEYWQFLGASRNPSPDPQSKNQQRTSDSPFFAHEEEESTSSEGKETPVPSEDFAGQCFEDQDSNALISSELAWPRRITKTRSMRNIQALNTEDSSLQLLLGNDEKCCCPSLEENVVFKASDNLGPSIPGLAEHYQILFPEMFGRSPCVTVYDPEDISVAPVFDFTLCTFRDEMSFSSLHDSQCSEEKPIPIFSCSRPTIRELTFPNPNYVFLSADCEKDDDISSIRVACRSFIQGSDCGISAAAPRGFHSWKGLLSMRRIRFHDKGSIWCRGSGAWVFPVEADRIASKRADPPITVLTEGRVSSAPSQLFTELAVQQRILETIQTRREGIFSTLKQSDMCLVCIAFASWVLRSSDPEAADAWKAALLANVSALSAIQYLKCSM